MIIAISECCNIEGAIQNLINLSAYCDFQDKLNLNANMLFIQTVILITEYITITVFIKHSIITSFLKDHLRTSLNAISFSRPSKIYICLYDDISNWHKPIMHQFNAYLFSDFFFNNLY